MRWIAWRTLAEEKLGWTTSSGLLQVRTLFGTNSLEMVATPNTSDRGNGVELIFMTARNRAGRQEARDGVSLSSRERSHDGDG